MLSPDRLIGLSKNLSDAYQVDSIQIVSNEAEGSPFRYQLVVNQTLIFSFDYGPDGWICSSSWVGAFFTSLADRITFDELELLYFLEGGILWWAHSGTVSSADQPLQEEINHASGTIIENWIEDYLNAKANDYPELLAVHALLLTWVEISESYGFADSEILTPIRNELGLYSQVEEAEPLEWPNLDEFEEKELAPSLRSVSGGKHQISREQDFPAWLRARRYGITATDARRLLRKNGKLSKQRLAMLREKLDDSYEAYSSSAMEYGAEREGHIAGWVSLQFPGARANDVLFEKNVGHLATPDMIHRDFVVEIKSSTKSLDEVTKTYQDQVQWQMYVLDRPRALLVVEDPETEVIEAAWIDADRERIANLVDVADCLLEVLETVRREGRPVETVLDESDSENFPEVSSPQGKSLMGRLRSAFASDSATSDEGSQLGTGLDDEGLEKFWTSPEGDPVSEPPSTGSGNPVREIRELCRTSQADFRNKFGFSKASLVSLESGMFASVSERQEAALMQLARERYFDVTAYLLAEHESADLNSAYKRWQRESRRHNFDNFLAAERPPFPFSRLASPLETLMVDTTGSIDSFCKAFKIQRISVTRYLSGETRTLPKQLGSALTEAGFQYLEELEESQSEWSSRFFS